MNARFDLVVSREKDHLPYDGALQDRRTENKVSLFKDGFWVGQAEVAYTYSDTMPYFTSLQELRPGYYGRGILEKFDEAIDNMFGNAQATRHKVDYSEADSASQNDNHTGYYNWKFVVCRELLADIEEYDDEKIRSQLREIMDYGLKVKNIK